MSSASTDPAVIPHPPPGTIWVAEIGPALNFLMIGATMGSGLVAMLLALFFFATPSMRRKPVFILNVLGLCLGVAGAITNVYEEFRTLLYPDVPLNPRVIIAMGAFDGLTPTLIDAILLIRLYAVYPYATTPRLKFLFIMGVPIATKIGRVINAAIFLNAYAHTIHASTGVGGAAVLITSRLPSIKIEWGLQVFDDVFSSAIFLTRVYNQSAFRHTGRTVSQALKALFWISTSNFVFPVILGIAQLAIYIARPDQYLTALYVEAVNFHFTIMGVVFATLWVAESRWVDSQPNAEQSSEPSAIIFNARSRSDGKSSRQPNELIMFSSAKNTDNSFSTYTDMYPPSALSQASRDEVIHITPESSSTYELAERKDHV